jgi:hypothetical protein
MFLKVFVVFVLLVSVINANLFDGPVINAPTELSYDEHRHLAENYLLVSDNKDCQEVLINSWVRRPDFKYRTVLHMTDAMNDMFDMTANDNVGDGYFRCNAICLDQGTDEIHILDVIPEKQFVHSMKNINADGNDLQATEDDKRIAMKAFIPFIEEVVMRVEIGFLNWTPNEAKIFWIDQLSGRRIFSGHLKRKERNTQWQTTTLGHVFEVEDDVTGRVIGEYIAKYPAINVIGKPEGNEGVRPVPDKDIGRQVKSTFDHEWRRANRVTRTFTELGFAKGKLPADLYSSIRTYYYNNRMQLAREEWEDKGLFVNWYEVEAYMIGIPWKLKTYWQDRLMPLVEAWAGVELELTDIYGMRRYEDGARLLTHVDREQTHAASLIINVAQHNIREPWMLEIYDFAGRLHEIIMEEGDIVYYESARCLHGRMRALHGDAYINLFAHYRPIGDPDWYKKSNPDGNPQQCIDVNEASEPIQNLFNQYVSPSGQVLTGA